MRADMPAGKGARREQADAVPEDASEDARAADGRRSRAGPFAADPPQAGSLPGAAGPLSGAAGPADYVLIGTDRRRWHPHCLAFATYAEAIAPPGRLPGRGMFEPTAIYRLLPHVWIVDSHGDPPRLRVRLAGTAIVAALGRDVTGLPLVEAFPGLDPVHGLARFVAAITARRGTWHRGPPAFASGPAVAEVEEVVMPFAADGFTVDMLYCCTVFYGHDGQEW